MALLQRFSYVILLLTLVACGGGDGFNVTDDTDTETGTITEIVSGTVAESGTMVLAISSPNISAAAPAIISATVTLDAEPVSGVLITFTLDNDDLGSFDPELGTVITGDDGIATIILNAGSAGGAGTIIATISANTNNADSSDLVATQTFSSAGDANTGSTPNVSSISLFASTQQIASSGAQEITLSAIAKDPNNNLLENVDVVFSATSGQIEVVTGTTGADGKATATLKTSNEQTNRIITTTATTASITDTVDVEVVGTTIQLTGSSSLAINDANDFIINVLDSDGNGIGQTPVQILTGTGTANITLPTTITTDFTGQATISITGTTGGENTIIANALGATATQSIAVQADSFLFSEFNNGEASIDLTTATLDSISDVTLSNSATLTITWLREGQAVPDGTVVNFTATRGSLSAPSATTVSGKASVSVSSDNAGISLVTFSGVDGDVELNNQLEFEFIAETADRLIAQASPHSIGPNGQTSTISVVVNDANGNLVKNKPIDFKLTDTSGGQIFPASAVTDSNGSASTIYTSNTVSAQDAVSIEAVVRDATSVKDTVTLTVADRELFISLGTGNAIEEPTVTTYNKQFSVFVTDVDSTPVENVELTVSAVPNNYYKGAWYRAFDDAGTFTRWERGTNLVRDANGIVIQADDPRSCNSEDKNIDGILDPGEDDIADGNGNGDGMLTPGNVVAALGNITTDENGQAIIDIRYAQSYGSWVDIDLVVTGRVRGTESISQTTFTLPTLADDILDEDITPPTSGSGTNGPFGYVDDCTNSN